MTSQLDSASLAQYLLDHPQFFEEHADLLAKIKFSSALGGRTVSLQERQMEVLREKIKSLELRMAELMRFAQENDAITDKFYAWTRSLLMARNDVDLPHVLADGLRTIFSVPYATVRLWGVSEEFAHTWFAETASDDAHIFAAGLTAPFCGKNNEFEAASWLEDATSVQSIAMISLRREENDEAFGLLVLGSPDPERFRADMATDFLAKIGGTASAALTYFLN